MPFKSEYDVVVIGAGIAGPLTALPLAQEGLRTLVIDRVEHPRFAVGESTIPAGTLLVDLIAKRWNIPELRHFSRYTRDRKPLELADYPKSHFWFGWQEEGEPQDPKHELVFETLEPPIGPDVHFIRAKVDEFLVSLLPRYRVDYSPRTVMRSFEVDDHDVVHLTLEERGQSPRDVTCRLVVDATGHRCLFSQKLGYLEAREELSLKTNTWTIYGHFAAEGMRDLDDVLGGPQVLYRHKRIAGTGHHCFPGGWIWVIPFDDGTVSIGIVMDGNRYPFEAVGTPEEQFNEIVSRFPTVKAHFGDMKPIGRLYRKPRSQIMSRSILGRGVVLTPHASAFIDPLFSTGILQTANFVWHFVPLASRAFETGDFDIERFRPLERAFFRDIDQIDHIVSGAIESFRDFEVFKQYWRSWIVTAGLGTVYALLRDHDCESPLNGLFGSNLDGISRDLRRMWTLLFESREQDQLEVARKLKALIDPHWVLSRSHPLDGLVEQVGAAMPLKVFYQKTSQDSFIVPTIEREIRAGNVRRWDAYWRFFDYFQVQPMKDRLRSLWDRSRVDPRRRRSLQEKELPWSRLDALR
jgi:tetracycline 7-halogenase / FADH2 O2-dependent halogenase